MEAIYFAVLILYVCCSQWRLYPHNRWTFRLLADIQCNYRRFIYGIRVNGLLSSIRPKIYHLLIFSGLMAIISTIRPSTAVTSTVSYRWLHWSIIIMLVYLYTMSCSLCLLAAVSVLLTLPFLFVNNNFFSMSVDKLNDDDDFRYSAVF